MLVVVSGLPGVGKSAVADAVGHALRAPVVSVDPIDAAMRRAGIGPDQPTGLAAYVVAEALARHTLALGIDVVIDAVNAVEPAQDQWIGVASDLGTPLRVMEVVCSDTGLHRARLAARIRDLPGFPEPTWDEVLRVRASFEPWTVDRLLLDSVDDLAGNVSRALAYVGAASPG